MIDIGRIAQAALAQASTLLPNWLADGRWDGVEWRCGDLSGAKGSSFACNSKTGRWSDFASGESGGDLVSLYAAIHRLRQGEAAREVAEQIGMDTGDATSSRRPPVPPGTPKTASSHEDAGPAVVGDSKARTDWTPVLPVPDDAGEPPRAHIKRGRPELRWDYCDADGRLLGCVYRFRTSDGGKEVLPVTYCQHPSGAREWRWVSFREPRPLYRPVDRHGHLRPWRDDATVLVVEGEKCADVACAELPIYDVLSWPGGGKAVTRSDWPQIAGRDVIVWPDCDAKRDSDGVLLPAEKQPGVAAMLRLAEVLRGLGCTVRTVAIPAPGSVADGWDVADAVAEGLTGDALAQWVAERVGPRVEKQATGPEMRAAAPGGGGESPSGAAASGSVPPGSPPPRTPPPAGPATGGDWRAALVKTGRGVLVDCRENVMLCLTHCPGLAGLVRHNEFSGRTERVRVTPWGAPPGDWTQDDDRELGLWLAQAMGLVLKSESALTAGVEMAAKRCSYHPVRDYLRTTPWDGVDRLDHWLAECLDVPDSAYVRCAGRYFLLQMVARVEQPGCHGDYMLVFEGKQGRGKSSALRVLGGPWFSDARFNLSDRDSPMHLEGVWLYEFAELDALSRAEVTEIKAFVSRRIDRYRPPYGTRLVMRPRQTVLAGSTNQDHYLRDSTGNRRFWPVKVGPNRDLVKLAEWRDQLLAEALHRVQAGERWYPSPAEEAELFAPAQEERVVHDAWHDVLVTRLLRADEIGMSTYTVAELLKLLGVSSDKIDGAGAMVRRVHNIMQALGWAYERRRLADGSRPHVYIRAPIAHADATPASPETSDEVPL